MRRFTTLRLLQVLFVVLLIFCGVSTHAQSGPPAFNLTGEGTISTSSEGNTWMLLKGTEKQLGNYASYSEIQFQPADADGTVKGAGVAMFRAENGDLLVGDMTCELDADGTGQITFSWRDSITLSSGLTISNTGRFVNSRPPGAKSKVKHVKKPLIIIIAILIG